MNGQTICIFSHGTTGSGKSCTTFGNGHQVGILARSVDFILNVEPVSLFVSIIEITADHIFDLLALKKKVIKFGQEEKKILNSVDDFNVLLLKVLKLRAQKSTNENKTSSRSHLMIRIEDGKQAKLTFFDLAGWECAKLKENVKETQFINSTLTSLNTAMEQIANKKPVSFDSNLAKAFKPYLMGTGKTCMLYHLSRAGAKKGLENIKNVIASSKSNQSQRKIPLMDITNHH